MKLSSLPSVRTLATFAALSLALGCERPDSQKENQDTPSDGHAQLNEVGTNSGEKLSLESIRAQVEGQFPDPLFPGCSRGRELVWRQFYDGLTPVETKELYCLRLEQGQLISAREPFIEQLVSPLEAPSGSVECWERLKLLKAQEVGKTRNCIFIPDSGYIEFMPGGQFLYPPEGDYLCPK